MNEPEFKKLPMLAPTVKAPGEHYVLGQPPDEVSSNDFANSVLIHIPPGQFYRRYGIVGHVRQGKFIPATERSVRLLVDNCVRIVEHPKPYGNASPREKFTTCSLEWAGIVLEKAATFCDADTDLLKRFDTVRDLKAICPHPVYSRTGECISHGWNDGILVTDDFPNVEPIPLWDVVCDFPMDDESKAGLLAYLLTPMFRPLLGGNVPLFVVTAPQERTGKTKLASEVIGHLLLGRPCSTRRWAKDEDEVEKRVISMLIAGESLLCIDNVPSKLDSPVLAWLVTAQYPGGRVLGESRDITCENTLTLSVTGNHVHASAENAKRSVTIKLQPIDDKPEERVGWKHPDLVEAVQKARAGILAWVDGLVRAWVEKGRPALSRPLGGFERWCESVGGIVESAGYPLLGNRDEALSEMTDNDSDLNQLIGGWRDRLGTGWVPLSRVVDLAHDLEWGGESMDPVKSLRARQTILGMQLRGHRNRWFGDVRLEYRRTAAGKEYRLAARGLDPEG